MVCLSDHSTTGAVERSPANHAWRSFNFFLRAPHPHGLPSQADTRSSVIPMADSADDIASPRSGAGGAAGVSVRGFFGASGP